MNANEPAEDLEGAKLVILRLNDMLRQQQAEIEALNRELLRYKSSGEMGYANKQ
jgi:hypothetical protein